MNDMTGPEIRAARRSLGWTATVLAAHLGVTRSAVSQWELGITTPSVAHLHELVGLFGPKLETAA